MDVQSLLFLIVVLLCSQPKNRKRFTVIYVVGTVLSLPVGLSLPSWFAYGIAALLWPIGHAVRAGWKRQVANWTSKVVPSPVQ